MGFFEMHPEKKGWKIGDGLSYPADTANLELAKIPARDRGIGGKVRSLFKKNRISQYARDEFDYSTGFISISLMGPSSPDLIWYDGVEIIDKNDTELVIIEYDGGLMLALKAWCPPGSFYTIFLQQELDSL